MRRPRRRTPARGAWPPRPPHCPRDSSARQPPRGLSVSRQPQPAAERQVRERRIPPVGTVPPRLVRLPAGVVSGQAHLKPEPVGPRCHPLHVGSPCMPDAAGAVGDRAGLRRLVVRPAQPAPACSSNRRLRAARGGRSPHIWRGPPCRWRWHAGLPHQEPGLRTSDRALPAVRPRRCCRGAGTAAWTSKAVTTSIFRPAARLPPIYWRRSLR